MLSVLIFVIGAIFGAAIVMIVNRTLKGDSEKTFKAASLDVMGQATDQLIKTAKQILDAKTSESSADLETKKRLIDQSLGNLAREMQERMEKVQKLMTEINQAVPEKYGQVSEAVKSIAQQSEDLRKTTESLNRALSSTQVRGQWGERMAEDILRIVGMQENVNYLKQKAVEGGGSRPDFTFLLPNGLKVNMDVKFPYDKYRDYLEADNDMQREDARKKFISSVKNRVKEVTGRDYINPDDNTVDYVLVFIPNEQIYSFIQETDPAIMDEALRQKAILCSPLTLYAMLALIRQAIDNFNLRRSSREIQALLGGFSKQWEKFVESMKTVGGRIDSARAAFDEMAGTRTRMLDRQIRQIDRLNKAEGIEPRIADIADETPEIGESSEESGEEAAD